MTNGLGQETLYSYYPDGQVACMQDPNKQITMYSYDPLGRISEIDYPDKGQLLATYSFSARLMMTTKTLQVGAQYIVKQLSWMGLGESRNSS